MVRRNSGNDAKLLKDQYALLRDALDSYYTGKQEQALNIATRIRVLVHDKPGTDSRSLLSRLNPDYWDLPIYDQPPLSKDTTFAMRTFVVTGAQGSTHIRRPIFIEKMYQRVSMKVWWTNDYQPLGGESQPHRCHRPIFAKAPTHEPFRIGACHCLMSSS